MAKSEPWFKPKSFGYGATPSHWKGWALTLGYVAMIVGLIIVDAQPRPMGTNPLWFWLRWMVVIPALTFAFLRTARRKTDGEWKWRGFDK